MVKIKAAQAESYCRQLYPEITAYLLYGPDQGLATERARRLVALVTDDPHDPFSIADLEPEKIRQSPGLLIEEAQAISMLGGRRVLRVRPAADALAKSFDALLKLPVIEAIVVVEAGDLAASSSLRKLFERAKNAVAIPCYRDEERDLAGTINSIARELQLRLQPDAVDYLRTHLGADRELTRRELEKLALIALDQPEQAMDLETVAKAVGDHSALLIDDWTLSSLEGQGTRAHHLLDRLLAQGDNPVRLLRALLNQTRRILNMRLAMESGEAASAVIAKARPPIHFRSRGRVERILSGQTTARLAGLTADIADTERACKSAGQKTQLLIRALTQRIAWRLHGKSLEFSR